MSKNMTRKGLAFGAGLSLVASGLAAVPASAAQGDLVTLAPNVGLNYGVFVNDTFTLKASYSTQLTKTGTSVRIDNPDQVRLLIDLDGAANPVSEVDLYGVSSTGVYELINGGDNFDVGTARDDGAFVVDFEAAAIVSLIITEMDTGVPGADDTADITSDTLTIAIQPVGAVTDNSAGAAVAFAAGGVEAFDLDANDTAAALAYGAGDVEVAVTSWIESEAVADAETIDTAYASLARTVTFYDPKGVVAIPRIERFNTNLNDVGNNLHATIEFNKSINYEMIDRTEWTVDITTGELPAFANDADLPEEENIAGLGGATTNADRFGRYAFDTGQAIAVNTTYTVNVHSELAEEATGVERWFSSTGYSIGSGTTTGTAVVEPAITDTADVDFTGITPATGADADQAADVNFATAVIRAGVKSVTYSTQLQSGAPLADDDSVSVPVMALVTNGSFMPTGSSITVAGNASPMTRAGEVRTVTGFTDADGQFSVTVNSLVANKNESYTVAFYVLRNGVFVNQYTADVQNAGGVAAADTNGQLSTIAASYSAATAGNTSLTAVNSVVAGDTVTVSFTVTDQFGEPISATSAGKALSISLAAPNTDNLNESKAVPASGEVSFTFTNYLPVGGSDLLSATLYTGTASDPTSVDTAVVTLYNTGATGAIQVPESLTGVITYVDYIPNGEKATSANPDPVNDIVFTGTVVDANGVGIPAAVVTIDAPGMQIQDGTKYYLDTRTTNANAAGVFSVNLNAHMVNTTGATVTVTTADGKTASTLVKTYLPSGANAGIGDDTTLNGNNLHLTVDMPENIVVNRTYAVTAKLTDKWGNPVKTSDNAVDFTGTGSIQVNGVSTAIAKDFDKNGEALVYIRSVKDIAGPGTLEVAIEDGDYTSFNGTAVITNTTLDFATQATVDNAKTDWDETLFESTFTTNVEVLETAPAASADQKVNAGSFKGYVALYAKGYAGQRMSAKVGNDWVVVPVLASNFERVVEYTGAGYTVAVRIYIDRVLIDTITVTTK